MKKIEGITPSQPQASVQAYRPPSARNRPVVKFTLHDDEESAHKPGNIFSAYLYSKISRFYFFFISVKVSFYFM